MLDIKSKLVLKILLKECPDGAYRIVESKDIISALPNKYRIDQNGLSNILIYLERQEFISIKYDDEGVYCLCVLPFGNEVLENENKKREGKKPPPFWLFITINFLATFLAGLLGAMIASILNLH